MNPSRNLGGAALSAPTMRCILVLSLVLVAGRAGAAPPASTSGAGPSLYQAGVHLLQVAEFEEAASTFERFAAESPRAVEAPDALTQAIVLRVGLNDERKVQDDVDRYERTYAATQPEVLATIDFARAAHASERGDWTTVERVLTARMSAIDRGPVYLRMGAHALLGKAFARHAGDARAATEYARVRALAASLEAGTSAPVDARLYAKGLNALGEAILFDADARRNAAAWTHVTPYAGSADATALDGWIATTVAPWIAARSRTIASVELEYQKVLSAGEVPSPRAVVEAASRVAMMWSGAADELQKVPVPPSWNPAARKLYRDKLAAAAVPLLARAKPAATACVAFSVKYQFTDEASAACGAWLTKSYRSEHPPLDELLLPRSWRANDASSAQDAISPLPDARP